MTGVELHARRPAAAARGAGAEIGDNAAADQMSAERADGGRRQAGGFDDCGPSERSRLLDRECEHAIEVQRAQMRRVAGPGIRVRLTLCRLVRPSCHVLKTVYERAARLDKIICPQ